MEQKTKTRKRVVSIPGEIAQPKLWADRDAHKRNVNAEPRTRSRLVKRTLAQTGVQHLRARYDSFVHYRDNLMQQIYLYVVDDDQQEAEVSGDE